MALAAARPAALAGIFSDGPAVASKCAARCLGPCCLPAARIPILALDAPLELRSRARGDRGATPPFVAPEFSDAAVPDCGPRRHPCGGDSPSTDSTTPDSPSTDSRPASPCGWDSDSGLGDAASPGDSSLGAYPEPGAVDGLRRSPTDWAILGAWDAAAGRGLFRYNVRTEAVSRVLPGPGGFIAQLNEGRAHKKRPTELVTPAVVQPFDAGKFHFGRAAAAEALFQIGPVGGAAAPVSPDASLLLINVSPIEYGHVLLVPRAGRQLPQRIAGPGDLLLAHRLVASASNPCLRVGYNSLGAYATVNHLHFQAYYLAAPLAIELAASRPLGGPKRRSVALRRLWGYPVRGWVLECADLGELAEAVAAACAGLESVSCPFNLLITAGGTRAFLLPNGFGARLAAGRVSADSAATGVNPAVFELSGHVLLKCRGDFEAATEATAAALLAEAAVSEHRFGELTRLLFPGA